MILFLDTHVWEISKKLGWSPNNSTRESTYDHLNTIITNEHKYSLHVLLVEHGKRCRNCSKGGKLQKESEGECPFKNWNIKLQEFSSSLSSSSSSSSSLKKEDINNRIEVIVKTENIYETPTVFSKRKENDNNDNDNESKETTVKRVKHWDLQNHFAINECKE